MLRTATARPAGQGEALATWALWTLVLVLIVVTYSRLDPDQLYNVSGSGLVGGFGRALVETNFPLALVAIALVLISADALPRAAWLPGGLAIALCAVTAWPGVVDQDDLDPKPINAAPALGVGIALLLTVLAARRSGLRFGPCRRLDGLRVALAILVSALSIPWIAAEAGVFLPDGLFLMQKIGREPDGTLLPAVHLGHHHGLDGAVLVLSGLLLSRVRPAGSLAGSVTRLYVALMLAYGAVNFANDLWDEQVVKRGWTAWKIPSALEPRLAPIWLVIFGLAGGCAYVLRRAAERA